LRINRWLPLAIVGGLIVRPADMSFRDIPEPFNIYHMDEAENHERILATIAKVMAGTPIPTRVPLYEIYLPSARPSP
jgi:hypothetical protein